MEPTERPAAAPPPRPHALARALAHRRAPAVVALLALLLALPSLAVGFLTDDHGFRAVLHAHSRSGRAFFDLYRFAPGTAETNRLLVRAGALPWWSAPDFKLHLVRPLASALFALDDALLGAHAAGYHLHSILWYLALLAAVSAVYRRLFAGPTATVALLVFALRAAHAGAYAWLSARHVLVAAAPATLALVLHLRAREDGWRPGRWLAPLALVVGLLGGEAALGGALFWLAYELLGPARDGGEGGWRRRLAACVTPASVALGYLLAYKLAGGGARSSGGYHDPLADPVAFARLAAVRLPVLLGDALLGLPAELSDVRPAGPLAAVGLGAVALLALLYLAVRGAIPARERAALRWLVPGALGAALVGVGGFPSGRVLVLPDVGFAALLGTLVSHGFARGDGAGAGLRALRVLGASALVLLHVANAPLAALHAVRKMARRARATERVARTAEVGPTPRNRVFLVAASDPLVFLYPRGVVAEQAPGRVRCWSVLSAARTDHRVTRTGERSFALEALDRPLLEGAFETLFRAPGRPFAAGDEVRQCGATIRVAAVRDGKPSRIDVEFDRPLDAPDLSLLVWREHRLRRFELPALGQTVDVPWEPGPSGAF